MIEVKLASSIHINTLCELFVAYRKFLQMPAEPKKSLAFLSQRLKQKDSLILIAFIHQQAAGFVQVYPSFSSLAMQPTWVINDLFVSSSFRRQGVGKELLFLLEKKARQEKIFSIKLATSINNSVAKKFYSALNYEPVHQFSFYSKHLEE